MSLIPQKAAVSDSSDSIREQAGYNVCG